MQDLFAAVWQRQRFQEQGRDPPGLELEAHQGGEVRSPATLSPPVWRRIKQVAISDVIATETKERAQKSGSGCHSLFQTR